MVEPTHLKNMPVKLDPFPKNRGEKFPKHLKPPPTVDGSELRLTSMVNIIKYHHGFYASKRWLFGISVSSTAAPRRSITQLDLHLGWHAVPLWTHCSLKQKTQRWHGGSLRN